MKSSSLITKARQKIRKGQRNSGGDAEPEPSVLLRRGNPIQVSQQKRRGVKSGEVAATQSSF